MSWNEAGSWNGVTAVTVEPTPTSAAVDMNISEPVFSISAGSVTPTSAAIDINIIEPVFSIFASDGTTVYYYSKGTQVRLF